MRIRTERLAQTIKKEVSEIIQFSLKDRRVGFVTVTDVTVTNDLSFAKIYINILDDEIKAKERFNNLKKAKGFIRSELAKKLTTYKVPQLIFIFDESLKKGNRIEEIIKNL
ncbi:MAG: 30S ribosome-binding factor RbfA [Erysipelotrichaceae bacterium]|nr:30S ribosome-binding factor RbfA [Erysipelotrichaceae bacterium]MDD4642210.1 30S ribosome-binding factor RbfA [Erysipelotrichaceae bacterium]